MEKLKAIIKKYDDITCSPDIRAIIDGCKELINKNNKLANACTGVIKYYESFLQCPQDSRLHTCNDIDCCCDPENHIYKDIKEALKKQ